MIDKIIVLDFGSQYNQLITRRIRDIGVYSELKSHKMTAKEIKADASIKGIIFSGGPNSVYDKNAFTVDSEIFNLNIPILGICYGMQIMAHELGGKIVPCKEAEYGKRTISITKKTILTKTLKSTEQVWMSHGDQVKTLPKGFINNASSATCKVAMMSNVNKKFYGIQFHPEVKNTIKGEQILKNFVFDICKAKNNWTIQNFIDLQVKEIKKQLKGDEVLCALSGGVDSSVVAALLYKAVGKKLTCMFVDHGLLRMNEVQSVVDTFRGHFGINLIKVDARKLFLSKLKNITDPEQKRKIIGGEFINVFKKETSKLSNIKWLAQGTIYADIIESGTSTAKTIKSHHNVGGLPKDMPFKLIEPLKMLFKDEVRNLGALLGLPSEIVNRQPFPGPGIGIRIIGDITEEKVLLVQKSDAILREEIKKAGLDKKIWQYFTILLDIRSVGVMGDQRTYGHTICIRAVTSVDGMTADWAKIPYDILDIISCRIVNEIKGINRVVYDCTSKPPATIEWE